MKQGTTMNQEQKKHLRERLRDAERAKDNRYENIPETEKPTEVLKAARIAKANSAIVDRWRSKIDRGRQSRYAAMMKRANKVRELILFGDPEKALAALHAFESSAK